jgi:hypothetical protein
MDDLAIHQFVKSLPQELRGAHQYLFAKKLILDDASKFFLPTVVPIYHTAQNKLDHEIHSR